MNRQQAINYLLSSGFSEEQINTIEQAFKQEPTTKNDLGVDCISRKAVLDAIDSKAWEFCDYLINKGRNDEQKPVSHFADNLRECVREELPSVTPQEPIEPMVEIDLYSVIKQKYIEREVLDKIRAEIDNALSDGMIHKKTVLGIIDKYKAESEKA